MTLFTHRIRRRVALAGLVLFAGGCILVSSTTERDRVAAAALGDTVVNAATKAHLIDGSVIVFADGFSLRGRQVRGSGQRFDASRKASVSSNGIAIDSVLGFEVFRRRINPGRTLVYGTVSAVASTLALAAAAIIIFGSCPTVYADSAGTPTLQAESFSYSISPLLAKRDVDRMTVQAAADGVVRLTVRNEALETHHLDHIEVIEVRHRADEVALPSPRGGAIAVSAIETPSGITDGSGRNVARALAQQDDQFFTTDNALLDRAMAGGPTDDALTIAFPHRTGVDSVALVLRARSSLLTTSILYEHLMGRQGARALDWMGEDLQGISSLATLAMWYGNNFGMRVSVQDGEEWQPVIRLMDFGPTAWREVGVVVPALRSADDSVRIRLTFAADAFRIDRLAVGSGVRRVEQRLIPIARAFDSNGGRRTDLEDMLSRADDRDVETGPGSHFSLEFDTARPGSARPSGAGAERSTFFFAAQGYYVEWLRPAWMAEGDKRQRFSPSTTSMRELLRSWKGGRDSLEAFFFTRRVPIA